MSHSNTDLLNTPQEDPIITLTDIPAHRLAPILPVLCQGDAATLTDLVDARAQLMPVLDHNKHTESQLDGLLLSLEGAQLNNIRCQDSSIPSPDYIKTYVENANDQLTKIGEALIHQQRVLSRLDSCIQTKTPPTSSSSDIDSYTTTINDKDNEKSKDKNFFIKVPSTVDRFGKSGSRNAKEFLRTFYTQIEAFSLSHDRNDGNTIGRLLGQVIEDVHLKNDFARDFVTSMNAKHPAKLTVDELSTIFIKHCGKTSDNIETSKRLLSMAPKTKESFVDYGKRVAREMQRSGTSDHCPAITSYLEGTVPTAACSIQRLWYLMKHHYAATGTTMPKIPTESFNMWYQSTAFMEGNVEDYGALPHDHADVRTIGNKRIWSGTTPHQGFKRNRVDSTIVSTPIPNSTTPLVTNTTPTDKAQNCGKCGWDNHTTTQCKAPLCAPCGTHHFNKHCPKNKGKGPTSHTSIASSTP
jgi:hypothetical protein